jgi:hypothetical protein
MEGMTKKKMVKIFCDIQESNHAMHDLSDSNRNVGDRNCLPWLLTEQENNVVKEVFRKSKFPMGFSLNIKNILMKKGEFGG